MSPVSPVPPAYSEAHAAMPDEFRPFPGPSPIQAGSPRQIDASATASQRTYATFMHLMLVIATFTVLPLVFGPLLMWMIKRKESHFIDDHGKEALNFNISMLIYAVAATLSFICGIGIVLLPAIWGFGLVFSVIASVAANKGEYYRYPACIRIIA